MLLPWKRQGLNKLSDTGNRSLALTVALAFVMLFLGLMPQATEALWQFDRTRIESGEWWRLITGQFIHYGFYHLAMNLSALLLCDFILLRQLSPVRYCVVLVLTTFTVGAGLYVGNPEMEFYGGFSGALHGLIITGLLLNLRPAPVFPFAALVLVLAKLIHEQTAGYDPQHPLLPVPVAVDAHLYGAIAGLLLGLILLAMNNAKMSASPIS